MEKSRAIELLEHLAWDRDIDRNPYGEALNIAIEALKAQLLHEDATSDTISKTETVEHLRKAVETTVPITDYDGGFIDGVEFSISTVSTMPTTQTVATDTNVGDKIYRQAAIDALDCINGVEEVLRSLPSAQPEPKEGHWIKHETPDGGEQYECSRCGVLWEFTDGTPEDNEAYFCPKCGMKLITKKIKGEQI